MKYVKSAARDVTNPPAAGTNVGARSERPQHLYSDAQIALAAHSSPRCCRLSAPTWGRRNIAASWDESAAGRIRHGTNPSNLGTNSIQHDGHQLALGL
jgi:hypothetical protein